MQFHSVITVEFDHVLSRVACVIHYTPLAKIESSPVWDISCLAELIYEIIKRQFLCDKCL